MNKHVVHVAAGVIIDIEGKVLIAKRPDGAHQGGLWEFPGGKLETDEPVVEALKRELHEELGIDVEQAHPLIRVHHDYPDKSVLLDVWKITHFSGEAHGKEGQPIQWVTPDELNSYAFPEANKPIIKAAQLPDRYLITGEYTSLKQAAKHLQQRIEQGIRLIQFRAHYLPDEDYIAWAGELIELCRKHHCALLLNREIDLASRLDADGIHLTSAALLGCIDRPVNTDKLLSASVHNGKELEKAMEIGVDFIVVAPVLATSTHPEAKPIGWDNFYELTEKARIPVYALGGMTTAHIKMTHQHGGQGIAAIRGLIDE